MEEALLRRSLKADRFMEARPGGPSQDTETVTEDAHLIGKDCVNFLLQPLLNIWVGGQAVRQEAEGGAGGLITSKDKDYSL